MDKLKSKFWFTIISVFAILMMSIDVQGRGGSVGGAGGGGRGGGHSGGGHIGMRAGPSGFKSTVPTFSPVHTNTQFFGGAPVQFSRPSGGQLNAQVSRPGGKFMNAPGFRSPGIVNSPRIIKSPQINNNFRGNFGTAPIITPNVDSRFKGNFRKFPSGGYAPGWPLTNTNAGWPTIRTPNTFNPRFDRSHFNSSGFKGNHFDRDGFRGSQFNGSHFDRDHDFDNNRNKFNNIDRDHDFDNDRNRFNNIDRNHFNNDRFFNKDFDRDFDRDRFHHNFVFNDRHHFSHFRVISPDFFFMTSFGFGNNFTHRPVYPFFHNGYVFVNPSGYWPNNYNYARYSWYTCYPYTWYGYNPIPYQYGSDNLDYYTYNYYGEGPGPLTGNELYSLSNYQSEPPLAITSTDDLFDQGVRAFQRNDYTTAISHFYQATQNAPDDKVLAFAYSQAYFAAGDYKSAAKSLREAMENINPITQGIFYPRGLYPTDEILFNQIELLQNEAYKNPNDSDLQLLLGYNYIGLGKYNESIEQLKMASIDPQNTTSINELLGLAERLQTEKTIPAGYQQTQ